MKIFGRSLKFAWRGCRHRRRGAAQSMAVAQSTRVPVIRPSNDYEVLCDRAL